MNVLLILAIFCGSLFSGKNSHSSLEAPFPREISPNVQSIHFVSFPRRGGEPGQKKKREKTTTPPKTSPPPSSFLRTVGRWAGRLIVSCYGARRERRIVLRKTKAEDASESIGGEEEEGEGKKKIVKAKSYAWVSLPSLFKPVGMGGGDLL